MMAASANVIHDGSDEVVELFPDAGKGNGKMRTGKPGGSTFGGTPMGKDVIGTWYGDSGSAARFFYCAKQASATAMRGLMRLKLSEITMVAKKVLSVAVIRAIEPIFIDKIITQR